MEPKRGTRRDRTRTKRHEPPRLAKTKIAVVPVYARENPRYFYLYLVLSTHIPVLCLVSNERRRNYARARLFRLARKLSKKICTAGDDEDMCGLHGTQWDQRARWASDGSCEGLTKFLQDQVGAGSRKGWAYSGVEAPGWNMVQKTRANLRILHLSAIFSAGALQRMPETTVGAERIYTIGRPRL